MRFPGFEGEWKGNILSDLGNCIGGGTPTSKNRMLWEGEIPWISSSDINENDINNIRIRKFITQEAIDKSATKFCAAPVILIVSRVGVGKIAHSLIGLCTSQDFTNIVNIKCNSLFLTYLLSHIMKVRASSTQGTSIKGITSNEIKSIKVLIPSQEEQEKIAGLLALIDQRIQTQSKI
ncbi:restriction endonuclease subunit S, partial [Pedobacter miscanthi]